MAFVYYKHAEIDRRYPRALAVCDRCGEVYNHTALNWQYDWAGVKLHNKRILVCRSCLDEPQEQRRQIILPRDPIPIEQPRLEPLAAEVGSLEEAFDGDAFQLSAFQAPPETPGVYGDFPPLENTAALNSLTFPVPANSLDQPNYLVTQPSSYFSINQDLQVG